MTATISLVAGSQTAAPRAAADAGVPAETVLADPGKYGLTQTDVTRYQNAEHMHNGVDVNAETDANGVPNPDWIRRPVNGAGGVPRDGVRSRRRRSRS